MIATRAHLLGSRIKGIQHERGDDGSWGWCSLAGIRARAGCPRRARTEPANLALCPARSDDPFPQSLTGDFDKLADQHERVLVAVRRRTMRRRRRRRRSRFRYDEAVVLVPAAATDTPA